MDRCEDISLNLSSQIKIKIYYDIQFSFWVESNCLEDVWTLWSQQCLVFKTGVAIMLSLNVETKIRLKIGKGIIF